MAQAKEARAVQGRAEASKSTGLRRKLTWVLTVVFVPLIAVLVMLGVALQFVGIPVVSTVESYLPPWVPGHKAPPVVVRHGPSKLQLEVKQLQTANQALSKQLRQKDKALTVEKSATTSWHTKAAALEKQLAAEKKAVSAAKEEASILTNMDAGAAAQVLAKLPLTSAARLVSQMAASDSAQILGQMDPAVASQILSVASGASSTSAATGQSGSVNGSSNTTAAASTATNNSTTGSKASTGNTSNATKTSGK